MKKILFSIIAGMVLFTSCDLLNTDPYDQFTKDTYFTNETNVEMYANYFYSEFLGYGNNSTYGVFYFPTLNDNQGVTGLSTWSYVQVPATNSNWNNAYAEIRRANTLIERIGDAQLPAERENNWVGMARLYRAWQHYKLVREFGDCYWVDKVLNTNDETILYGARTDRDVVMDSVLADLNFAVTNIIDNASSRTAINVYVANAMKAEICLYEGTFCKYRTQAENGKEPNTERANKYLGEAKTACKVIIDSQLFTLTDGVDGYRANYNSNDLDKNKEMIMYKKYIIGILGHGTQDYCAGSTQTNGMSKAAFDSYLFTDGKPLASTSLDKSDHAKVVPVTYADTTINEAMITDMLAVRDPRLAQQIDPELRYPGHGVIRYRDDAVAGKPGGAAENTSSTGYGILKFDNPTGAAKNRQSTTGNETDAPIYWYALILLNYAEACAESGDDAEATNTINLLRTRVGMPALTLNADPANNMGVSDLIWEVRRERRVELMFDNNDRYYCLIRWHQLDKLDTKQYPDQVKGAWMDSTFPGVAQLNGRFDSDGYLDLHNGNSDRIFDAKYYLSPIPSGQISLNANIGQNPGW